MVFTIKSVAAPKDSVPSIQLRWDDTMFPGLSSHLSDKYRLGFGTRSVDVHIKKAKDSLISPKELLVNKAAADALLLRDGQRLHLKLKMQGVLELGPLIGYFISNRSKMEFGNSDFIYTTFLRTARELGGEAILFSIDDVDWKHLSVKGYFYDPECPGGWAAADYPLPRLIYNRCMGVNSKNEVNNLLLGLKYLKDIVVVNPEAVDLPHYPVRLNIKPAQIIGCPIEMRILVQKNYKGLWCYTGGAICLNPAGSQNIPKNFFGRYPLDSGLQEVFPNNFIKIKENSISKALIEAGRIGQQSEALTEMEFKIGVDESGRTWVKNAIKRPTKTFLTRFKGSTSGHQSVVRPLHYFYKLTGYQLASDPEGQQPIKSPTPLIGIFEELDVLDDIKSQKADHLLTALTQASDEIGCLTYHFSLPELAGFNCIQGWYYDQKKQKWAQKKFPWPRVFYDRATFRRARDRRKAKQFRKDLRLKGGTVFLNSRSVFGKGFTSEVLQKMNVLKDYLPYDVKNPSPGKIRKMIDRYDSVFVKTEHGSDLRGVVKIERQKDTYAVSNRYETNSFRDFAQVWAYIKDIVGADPYVAQEGINAASYRSNPLNIRTIVQKNNKGIWEVGLVKPWIATSPQIRGFPLQWSEIASKVLYPKAKAEKIFEKICHVSLLVAKTLEAHTGPLGELGIDLVPDQTGHPWIIEVNGKTNKSFFIKDETYESYYKLFYNPLAYGSYLANRC